VIGTPRGNLEDPRVEFTALEWGGHSNPNVRPTLFSLQVPSSMAEQWPDAKTFIRQCPRVYRHEVFFSPLPESITTQQGHFNRLFDMAALTSDLHRAACPYFKSKLAAQGPDAQVCISSICIY
jgi:hypothetical protein